MSNRETGSSKKRSSNKTLIVISTEFVIIAALLVIIGFSGSKDKKNDEANAASRVTGTETQVTDTAASNTQTATPADNNSRQDGTSADTAASNGDEDQGSNWNDLLNKTETGDGSGEPDADAVARARDEEQELINNSLELHKAEVADVIAAADLQAAMYDYDKAMETIRAYEGYEQEDSMTAAIASYEEQKAACVKWHDNTQISHVFFHSLIYDTSRAFGPTSSKPGGYNQYMTTVSEFNKMIESMYERGFVLVSVHDIARLERQEDGTEKLVAQPIYLPEGKEPFVLSQDDVNYYLYMDNDGFADRLVIGEDGLPTCMYIDKDGTVSYG